MKAVQAAEFMDGHAAGEDTHRKAAAVLIAIAGLGAANASKEIVNSNILASNAYAFIPGEEFAEGRRSSWRGRSKNAATVPNARTQISTMPMRCCISRLCSLRSASSPDRALLAAVGAAAVILTLDGFLFVIDAPILG